MRMLFGLTLLLLTSHLRAQTDTAYIPPTPRIELRELAGHFLDLDWTAAQYDSLRGSVVELTFYVDDIGEPYLYTARGIEGRAIFERMVEATERLMYFEPARRGERRVGGEYVFWLQFPRFGEGAFDPVMLYPQPPGILNPDTLREKFERTRNAVFVDVNPFYSNYTGEVGTYLRGGVGIDVTLGGRWSDRLGAGLVMGLEGNDRHRSFPDDPYPDRDEWSSGLYIGGLVDYNAVLKGASYLSLRPELAYGILNAANRLDPDEKEGSVQYRGLHTGLVLHYSFRLGAYKPNVPFSSDYTSARFTAINLEAGYRYRHYGDKAGTGGYWFVGAGWRWGRDDFRRRNQRSR